MGVFNNFRAVEFPYGDKDQSGEFTLQVGDVVEFTVATDRRDKLQRATKIELCPETFNQNSEKREKVRLRGKKIQEFQGFIFIWSKFVQLCNFLLKVIFLKKW